MVFPTDFETRVSVNLNICKLTNVFQLAMRHPAVLRDAKSPEEVGRERGGWWEVPGRWELV